ncbi:MAG TPA: hypothetical protein VHV55_10635 [Pirellulales bacterium]|jgi:hypothetical protein|nr:hypothetical protein [Pirellulales bacterium]
MQHTFEQIEDLKRQYTDKYVLVDTSRPELRRFQGETGRVKTVNMSGRALVQFDMANNIGWYDIGLDFLRVVDGPQAKPAEPEIAGHDRASAPAKVKPDSPAATAGGKKIPEPGPAKKSTADILAAARAKGAGAETPAAGKAPAAKPPAAGKPAGGKLSTADILAAARAAKEHASEEQPAPVAEDSPEEAEVEELEAEAAAEAPPVVKASPKSSPAASGAKPTSTAEIIAWCRQHDAK